MNKRIVQQCLLSEDDRTRLAAFCRKIQGPCFCGAHGSETDVGAC